MVFNVRIDGDKELERAVKRLPRETALAMRQALDASARVVRNEVRKNAEGSELKSGIETKVDNAKMPRWAEIFTTVFYARFQEFGTGLFGPLRKLIRPKSARVLRWQNKQGQVIFAKFTKGRRRNPFFAPAIPASMPGITKIMREALRRIGIKWKNA